MSAFDTLTAIPCQAIAGEYISWSEVLPDYVQGTYTVAYNFVDLNTPVDGFEKFAVSGTGSGTTWTFTLPQGGSAPKPGKYRWQQVVTRVSDSAKAEIASGSIILAPDFTATPTTSNAAAQLAALETVITSLSAGQNQSTSFNGQTVTKKDLTSLMRLKTDLQAEVLREQKYLAELSGETPSDGVIGVRFK